MGMKMKKIFSVVLVFFFAVCALSALSIEFGYDGSVRDPDSSKRRDDELVGVIIRANVEADIYINGKHFGKTPFATVDLSATHYNLELRRDGYDTISCKIYPRRRYTYTYEFVMQKTCGFISVKNYPSGSYVYVDGTRESSFPVEVTPGNHTVKVRKFGYEDYVERFYVENHKTVTVNVSLKTAPFKISDFKISKSKINPDYTSGIGKVTFSFDVTNDGSAILSVNDRYGNDVWSHEYKSFSTWEQSITWDGKGNNGERIPDGQYTVNLYSFDYDQSIPIKIDRSMIYPLSVYTPSGSGIGSLPCAFGDGVNYVKLFVDFGPMINMNGDKISLYSLPITTGMIVDFARYWELSGSVGVGAATANGKNPILLNGGLKRNFVISLGSGMKMDIAGLIDYNYCNTMGYAPLGSGIGEGLGLGFAAAFETNMLYFGVSGEYSFAKTTNTNEQDILKYGAVASFKPVKNLKTSAWASMTNNKVIEGGVEFITMPGSGAFCFDAKASVLTDITSENKNMFINAKFGLSYLF